MNRRNFMQLLAAVLPAASIKWLAGGQRVAETQQYVTGVPLMTDWQPADNSIGLTYQFPDEPLRGDVVTRKNIDEAVRELYVLQREAEAVTPPGKWYWLLDTKKTVWIPDED